MSNFFKSPLRYPGGKSRAVGFLKDFVPREFSAYFEPFFGGGSLGIYLAQKAEFKGIKIYANDLNFDLFCFWQILKTQNKALISEISTIKHDFKDGRALYEALLARREADLSELERAADFFVLNRITFSGLIDCGGYSQKAFESRFTASSIERLKDMDKILANVEFSCEDYAKTLQKADENAFVFLDPPYFSAAKSRLYGKKGDLHTHFEHENLHEILQNLRAKFVLTYDDSAFVRELYKDFYTLGFSVQYGMNNFKQSKANKGQELLISNFPIKSKERLLFVV